MGTALQADYLFVGPQIQDRLRAQLAGMPVEGIEQLAQAGDGEKRQRVVYVMWDGDRFITAEPGRAGGTSQLTYQRWLVLLFLRHASTVDKDARATAAGPLLSSIHYALAGFVPTGATRPLQRAQGRGPDYSASSGLLPLTFEIALHL